MPTPQHINPSILRYLTTLFHHLRTVGQFVLDHVLQRANCYISCFSFRFAPFSSIDRTPTYLNFVPASRADLPFLFLILHFHPVVYCTYCSGVGMQTGRGREVCRS